MILLVLQRKSLPHLVANKYFGSSEVFARLWKTEQRFSVEHGVLALTTVLGPAAVLCQPLQCLGDS